MTDVQNSDLFLVGSMAVPSDSVDEALQIGAKALGDRLFALPDGEVGLRSWWIAGLGQLTFSRHPDLDEGPESSGSPQPLGTFGVYSVKKGVTRVDLEGYLPYAQAAIDSYAIFRKLKDSKELPEDVRFQVALPTPFAAIMPFFQDTSDWPEMNAAWMRAVHADIARILEVIPAHELMIQWDYCTEVCDIVGTVSGRRELEAFLSWIPDDTAAGKCATHTAPEYLRPLAEGIPDQVKFGYHICLGTFPQFPITPIDDLSWIVRMANALVKNTPRAVDFVHLPVTLDVDRDFFAPLKDLDVGDARVFLGIGHRDGTEAIAARGRLAREFLPDFGISHYCGYGRDDRARISELLGDLRGAADLLRAAQT